MKSHKSPPLPMPHPTSSLREVYTVSVTIDDGEQCCVITFKTSDRKKKKDLSSVITQAIMEDGRFPIRKSISVHQSKSKGEK